jgi:glycosyltransferase involved in cell wall biosynthesis
VKYPLYNLTAVSTNSHIDSSTFIEIDRGDTFMHELSHHLRVSVVIPARNEASNLQHVLPFIPSFVNEVILVDGHSTDNTIAAARHLLPSIRIIEQEGKGKGDALRAGLDASTGDILVLLDADGSADPREISRFIEVLLAGSDFAKGSRFLKGGGSHDITFIRRAGNYFLSTLVNVLYRTRFTDLCYGYNAFWRHCYDHLEIDCDGFEIETLINIRMHMAGRKIDEVPSFEYPRIYGASNLNTFRDGWRVLKTIIKERWRKPSYMPQTLQAGVFASSREPPSVAEEIIL